MYRVLYGNNVLHDPRDQQRILTDAKAELAVNEAGSLSFTVQPNHPMFGKLRAMNKDQEVVLENDGKEIFRGRIISIKEGFYGGQDIVCEGDLAYLNDITVRPYSTADTDVPSTVDSYFAWLILQYNNKTDKKYRFTVDKNRGNELNSNKKIVIENDSRPSVAQEIKEKLLQTLGGYVRTRRSGDMRIIDYLSSGDHKASQRIEFGSNLLDFTREKDYVDYYTVIIPIGTDDSEGSSNDKIDISKQPNRELAGGLQKKGDRIIDVDAARKYGHIERTVEFEGVTDAASLVEKGARHLRNVRVGDVLEMTAVDLSMVDPSIKPIYIGDFVRATSRPHGYDEYFVCSKMTINVTNPSENTFTLGNEYDYMTGKQSAKLAALNASINSVYEKTTRISAEAKKAAQDAMDAASTAVKEYYEEYTVTNSRTTKPGEDAVWVSECPIAAAGQFIWRRTITTYGDGTTVTGDSIILTGESIAAVEVMATNGSVIRNNKGSTTLKASVLFGGDRITDLATLQAYFGDGACLQWNENDEGTFVAIASDDPRLSDDGFSLVVNASDITGYSSYICALMTTT